MKRVLLTGATGFIGRHCLPSLLSEGFEVHAVARRIPREGTAGGHWYQADLLDTKQGLELISRIRPTHLLHLAWYCNPSDYWTSLENLHWVQASLGLLQAFASNGGERVVMAGTCAEYDWKYGYCSEYITPVDPATLYGACKHSLQIMLDAFAGRTGISASWGRIFFVYGPNEHPSRLVASVICSLLKGEPAPCSHGNQVRDFLYVEDVARAFVSLLDSDVKGPVNIASGRPVTLREIVSQIAEEVGRKAQVLWGAVPVSADEPRLLVANVNRLTHEVGWLPNYTLKTGIQQTVSWWEKHLIEEESHPTRTLNRDLI